MSTAVQSDARQTDDRQSRPVSNILAEELAAGCAAHPSDKVIIVGAEQLDLLLALLRRGFTDVDCLSAGCGPHPQRDGSDILIAPAVRSESELLHILQRFGCTLRPRGVIIVHEAASAGICNDCRLRQMFLEAGFAAVERQPSRGGTGHLWRAYKETAAIARAA